MQAEQRTTLLEDYAWKRPRSTSHGPSSTDRRARARDWNTTKMTMLPLNPFVRRVDNKSPPPTSPVRSPRKRRRAKSHLNTPSTSSSSLFGEYTVKCPLRNAAAAAGGGGASLFIAKSRLTSEEVVLKMIDKTLAKKKVVRQLKKEALVMACLQHFEEANRTRLAEGGVKEKEEKKARRNEAKKKRIVPLLQVVEDTQCLCLVMPLAQAGDLFDYISSNRGLPREEAWRIFEQLVEGLSFAHSCGFIHRDIKPENIFLDADGDVLIGDWGYGTHWSSLSLKNRSCGSPNYVAGELLREAAYVGPEVDVFSLGVVFYACLTGNLPFGNSKRPDYAQRVKQGDWNDHPVLTPVERKLLDAMFQPNPLKRVTLYDVSQYLKEWRKRQTRYSVLSKGSNS